MRVIIIGGGLIGLSTAYFLQAHGAEIVLLERRGGPGLEASFANGSLLTPSMPEPWNAPGIGRELFRVHNRESSPFLLRMGAIPSLLGWGTKFLLNSRAPRFEANTLKNVRLARYSLECTIALLAKAEFDCNMQREGTLRIFRKSSGLDYAAARAAILKPWDVRSTTLDPAGVVALEPALKEIAAQLVGGLHYPDDAHGNAFDFCRGLSAAVKGRGAHLLYGLAANRLNISRGKVVSVLSDNEEISGDIFVVAAGFMSTSLCHQIGLTVPVQPVKGYSITFSCSQPMPRIPVIDNELHAAVVPLGQRVRVAGTAEFAGNDLKISRQRIDNLWKLLSAIYPRVHRDLNPASLQAWAGLRPVFADGVPIIGATLYKNLFLNTGHGPLGWTMAVGSGRALADLICGYRPAIGLDEFAINRF